ncbi:MAG: hypothetical protein JW966_05440 [Anaerolineae bacterium]|nr:hypothetical protein [Anaerolineae bacterium]
MCRYIQAGWLVGASVTPELGERHPRRRYYGGHVVLVFGFLWDGRRPTHYMLHNPSGRYAELQAGAVIPAPRFNATFARRLIALRPIASRSITP